MDQTFEKRKKVIYDFICDDFYIPMKVKEIATVLQVSKEQRRELQEVLDALVEEGKITLSKRGKYSKGQTKRITGTFQANIRGFGFVMVESHLHYQRMDSDLLFFLHENRPDLLLHFRQCKHPMHTLSSLPQSLYTTEWHLYCL